MGDSFFINNLNWYLNFYKKNMDLLHSEIGSAKDNFKSPVHNWYKFTAGFSYKFVDGIIELENLKSEESPIIFDPFSGCGTTLVSCQKHGIKAVGNESQLFMLDVINAKLNWNLSEVELIEKLNNLKGHVFSNKEGVEQDFHTLLETLYTKTTLTTLYTIRNFIRRFEKEDIRLFFKLALSQTLHKVSIHPIAVPYISRNKILKNEKLPWDVFEDIFRGMISDLIDLRGKKRTSRVYNHDSRKKNQHIKYRSCDLCITSPPYLNNLDYGEVSKVHTHFFEITDDWGDITNKVRRKLVTGSTTHYKEAEFNTKDYMSSEFVIKNKEIVNRLMKLASKIKKISQERAGKKSFNILMLYYFKDMYEVLNEIRRVLKNGSKAYLILGDSAPYGVYVETTKLLGEIALNCGFSSYEIEEIRSRGTKWKSLKYRHSIRLSENLLILE